MTIDYDKLREEMTCSEEKGCPGCKLTHLLIDHAEALEKEVIRTHMKYSGYVATPEELMMTRQSLAEAME